MDAPEVSDTSPLKAGHPPAVKVSGLLSTGLSPIVIVAWMRSLFIYTFSQLPVIYFDKRVDQENVNSEVKAITFKSVTF
jgi:hypothetical protein